MLSYVALAIFPAIPVERIVSSLGLRDAVAGKIGVFFILLALLIWLLGARRAKPFSPGGSWWQVLLLSFTQVGLLTHITISFLTPDRIEVLSPLTRRVFADPDIHLWWLVAPAALLILIRRLEMREG
mgnify:FL=1